MSGSDGCTLWYCGSSSKCWEPSNDCYKIYFSAQDVFVWEERRQIGSLVICPYCICLWSSEKASGYNFLTRNNCLRAIIIFAFIFLTGVTCNCHVFKVKSSTPALILCFINHMEVWKLHLQAIFGRRKIIYGELKMNFVKSKIKRQLF